MGQQPGGSGPSTLEGQLNRLQLQEGAEAAISNLGVMPSGAAGVGCMYIRRILQASPGIKIQVPELL